MTANSDNYDPQALLKKLADNLQQPDKFAETFCEAAKKQKSIDATLKEVIKDLITSDQPTRDELKKIFREVDKEDWTRFVKKVGATGWSIIMIAIGAMMKEIFGLLNFNQ